MKEVLYSVLNKLKKEVTRRYLDLSNHLPRSKLAVADANVT